MRVRITGPARANLEKIADYIAERDPLAADGLVTRLVEAAMSLSEFPKRFPLVEHATRPTHKMTVGNHLILYQVRGDRVDVIRIVHAATDWIRDFR